MLVLSAKSTGARRVRLHRGRSGRSEGVARGGFPNSRRSGGRQCRGAGRGPGRSAAATVAGRLLRRRSGRWTTRRERWRRNRWHRRRDNARVRRGDAPSGRGQQRLVGVAVNAVALRGAARLGAHFVVGRERRARSERRARAGGRTGR